MSPNDPSPLGQFPSVEIQASSTLTRLRLFEERNLFVQQYVADLEPQSTIEGISSSVAIISFHLL